MSGRPRFVLFGAAFVLVFCARTALGQCPGGLTFTYTGSNFAGVGAAYSAVIDTHGASTGAVTVSSSSNLPPGLALRPDHQDVDVVGTPTRAGVYDVSVTVLEPATSNCGTATFRITVGGGVSAIAISPPSVSDGVIGTAYSQTLIASGGTGAYTFSSIGALPPGLAISTDGVISGAPTLAGEFNFGVAVTAATAGTGRADYTLVVTATPAPRLLVTLTDGGSPWGQLQDITYDAIVTNVGTASATNVTLSLVIDAGLAFQCDDDSLSGLARTVSSPYSTIHAGQSRELSVDQKICLDAIQGIVGTNALALQSYQLVTQASAAAVETVSNTVVAVTPYCTGAACATFCPLRYLSGFPCSQIDLSPPGRVLPAAVAGSAYRVTFAASGATAPYHFAARDLPPGLAIDESTGVLSGIASAGRFEVTVGAKDASASLCHAEQTYVLDVCPGDGTPRLAPQAATPGDAYALPSAVAEILYTTQLHAICGAAPLTVDASPAVPPGLELFTTGADEDHGVVLKGAPTTPGDYTFSIRLTDAAGKSSSAAYSLHVGHCSLQAQPETLPPATVGMIYTVDLTVTGGSGAFEVLDVQPHCDLQCNLITNGASETKLEAYFDLRVSPDGIVAGLPAQAGSPAFTVFFRDSSTPPCFGSKTYTLDVLPSAAVCPPIDVEPPDLPAATVGVAYSVPLTASGGSVPYRWGSDRLTPDSGLVVDSSGVVVGTPLREGQLDFDVYAQDQNVCFGSRSYSIPVAPNAGCSPVYVSPWTLASGTVGVPYTGTAVPSDRIQASGGTRPYRLTLATMPAGLGLSLDPSTGELTGTPSQAGTYAFTVTATDSNPAGACSGSFRYSVEIQPGILSKPASMIGGLMDAARGAVRRIGSAFAAVRTVLRDLTLYYRIRDRVLNATPGGRELTRLYYHHAPEITSLLQADASLRDLAFAAASAWEPGLRSLDAGTGANVLFTPAMASSMNALLARLRQTGSSGLAADVAAQQASIDFASWVGLTMDGARRKLDARGCVASDSALCLNASRFRVEVSWRDFAGNSGSGHAVALTADTGYFWFFTASNVELVVKALDGRAFNQRYWLFYGALSNVEYTLTVTDTVTGAVKIYSNPSGHFGSVGDTDAFPGS